jgi:hypothetical protein
MDEKVLINWRETTLEAKELVACRITILPAFLMSADI